MVHRDVGDYTTQYPIELATLYAALHSPSCMLQCRHVEGAASIAITQLRPSTFLIALCKMVFPSVVKSLGLEILRISDINTSGGNSDCIPNTAFVFKFIIFVFQIPMFIFKCRLLIVVFKL